MRYCVAFTRILTEIRLRTQRLNARNPLSRRLLFILSLNPLYFPWSDSRSRIEYARSPGSFAMTDVTCGMCDANSNCVVSDVAPAAAAV